MKVIEAETGIAVGHFQLVRMSQSVIINELRILDGLTPVLYRGLEYFMINNQRWLPGHKIMVDLWEDYKRIGNGPVHHLVDQLRREIEILPRNPQYLRSMPSHGYFFDPRGDSFDNNRVRIF